MPRVIKKRGGQPAVYSEYTGRKNGANTSDRDTVRVEPLKGDGDFRSEECIGLLEQADVVVTNPPFSLFRDFMAQLMRYGKKFLILGHRNAVIYKDVFRYVKDNSLWLGVNNGGTKWFEVPEGYDMATSSRIKLENGKKYFSLGNTVWFTNLETAERRKDIALYEKFNPAKYPKYDNYDAIEVSRVAEIPADYEGIMVVPVTFLDRYNPEQFEILGSNRGVGQDADGIYGRASYCNGKETFKRLFIRNKRVLEFHT